MEITFEYTFEELHEGLTRSPEVDPRKRPGFGLVLVAALLLVALVLVVWALHSAMRYLAAVLAAVPMNAAAPPPPPAVDAMTALLPSAVAAAFAIVVTGAVVVAIRMMHSPNRRLRDRSAAAVAIGVVVAALVAWGGAELASSVIGESRWRVSRGQAVALAPWVIFVLGAAVLAGCFARGHLRRQWNTKPYLRRRRTVLLDEAGERIADGATDMRFRWPCFRRAWETENVLVLLDENDTRHILPKRAMDQATLEQARSIVSNHVADCTFLTAPGGFPVLASPPPRLDGTP